VGSVSARSLQCAVEIAPVVCHLVNFSLQIERPPVARKKAIITPVPKVAQPKESSDFRPISVT